MGGSPLACANPVLPVGESAVAQTPGDNQEKYFIGRKNFTNREEQ